MNRAETTKTEMCNLCSVKVVYMRLETAYLILRLFCFEMKCSCRDVSSPVVVDVVGGGAVDGCRNWDNGSRKTNDRKLWRKFSLIVVAMARIMMMMMAVVVVTTVTERSSDEYIRYEMATLKQMENRKSFSRSSVQFYNCDTQHVCVFEWVWVYAVHACVNKIHMCNGLRSYIHRCCCSRSLPLVYANQIRETVFVSVQVWVCLELEHTKMTHTIFIQVLSSHFLWLNIFVMRQIGDNHPP